MNNWTVLSGNNVIKNHIVHNSTLEQTIADVMERHKVTLSVDPSLYFDGIFPDPGGPFKLGVGGITFNVDGLKIRVNKQHMYYIPVNFSSTARHRAGAVKFNSPAMIHGPCVVMPEFLFGKLLNHMSAMEKVYGELSYFSKDYIDDGDVLVDCA